MAWNPSRLLVSVLLAAGREEELGGWWRDEVVFTPGRGGDGGGGGGGGRGGSGGGVVVKEAKGVEEKQEGETKMRILEGVVVEQRVRVLVEAGVLQEEAAREEVVVIQHTRGNAVTEVVVMVPIKINAPSWDRVHHLPNEHQSTGRNRRQGKIVMVTILIITSISINPRRLRSGRNTRSGRISRYGLHRRQRRVTPYVSPLLLPLARERDFISPLPPCSFQSQTPKRVV